MSDPRVRTEARGYLPGLCFHASKTKPELVMDFFHT